MEADRFKFYRVGCQAGDPGKSWYCSLSLKAVRLKTQERANIGVHMRRPSALDLIGWTDLIMESNLLRAYQFHPETCALEFPRIMFDISGYHACQVDIKLTITPTLPF